MGLGAWVAAWVAVGWTAGLIWGQAAPVPWTGALLVAAWGFPLGALLALLRRPLAPALVLGAVGLGLLRASFTTPAPAPSIPPPGQGVGLVVTAGPPEQIGGLWRFTGKAEVASGPLRVGHKVLVYLGAPPEGGGERWPPVQRGDRLYLSGRVHPLPEGGVGRALSHQGVVGVLRFPEASLLQGGGGFLAAADRLRWRLALALRRAIHQPDAGLGQALLLGIRGDMLPEEWDAFRQAGTAHLLAVSGLHVALVLGILEALTFAFVGRGAWGLGVPLVGLWGYAVLAGLGPPVVRAAMMGSVALGARAVGRPYAPLASLAVTVGVMAGLSPSLLGQASFQLSVAGMGGLVALGMPLQALLHRLIARWEKGRPWLSALARNVALSLGASLGAVPLAALTFERLPVLGVVSTLLSLPLLLPALVLSGVTALLGLAWEPLGSLIAWPTWVVLAGLRLPSAWLAQVPWASLSVQGIGPWVWGFYTVLALLRGWPFLLEAIPQWAGGRPLALWGAFPLLGVVAVLMWSAALQVSSHRLVLEAFPDGSWVLYGPRGQVVVATAGPGPRPVLR
ncbi:MAG: ComEC/Rec2 family competence protein, partial [Dehalococcoidia bacterium]